MGTIEHPTMECPSCKEISLEFVMTTQDVGSDTTQLHYQCPCGKYETHTKKANGKASGLDESILTFLERDYELFEIQAKTLSDAELSKTTLRLLRLSHTRGVQVGLELARLFSGEKSGD